MNVVVVVGFVACVWLSTAVGSTAQFGLNNNSPSGFYLNSYSGSFSAYPAKYVPAYDVTNWTCSSYPCSVSFEGDSTNQGDQGCALFWYDYSFFGGPSCTASWVPCQHRRKRKTTQICHDYVSCQTTNAGADFLLTGDCKK
jgi:hypothetical protein